MNSAILPTSSCSLLLNAALKIVIFFTLSIHTVNYHPNHQLSFFKVILPCTELYLHDLVAYSFVNCETEFSSSLDCSISSSGFSISEDVIVVTEERVKEVGKPWSSPGIYTGSKAYFPLCMTIMVNFECCDQ